MSVVIAPVAFWVDGKLRVPGDNGVPFELPFKARFTRMKKSERIQFMQRLVAREVTDEEVVKGRLVDWQLNDLRGEPVPYTEANRDLLIEEVDGLEAALAQSYFVGIGLGAAEKNSGAPSDTTLEPTAQTATT